MLVYMIKKSVIKKSKVIKKIFKAYDIRGRYPEEINVKAVAEIAAALMRHFKRIENREKRIVVIGHDARLSSPTLYGAALRVMYQVAAPTPSGRSSDRSVGGIKIIEAGMITTPLLYFLVNHLKAVGGIMITASHNPKEFNGMKVVGPKAVPMSGKEIQKILSL